MVSVLSSRLVVAHRFQATYQAPVYRSGFQNLASCRMGFGSDRSIDKYSERAGLNTRLPL